MNSDITFTLTSCGRLDLLERTLASFRKHVDLPIARWMMIEDSGDEAIYQELLKRYPEFEIKFNPQRIGPIRSLFNLYDGTIDTPWIFHCEDDWEFVDTGFMAKSMAILEHDPNLLQVWLRAPNDTNGHEVLPEVYTLGDIEYRMLSVWMPNWCGYSANPGLRRTSDQDAIDRSLQREVDISIQFLKAGRRAAIFTKPYIVHIGVGQSAWRGEYREMPPAPDCPRRYYSRKARRRM